ncbi:MAG: sodium:calcium antiporter [Euryarchaeota archaeon]|nr:sodium:calcium antiporter [Euryarchaeota archaeon]MBT4982886.1 sodium:calcium antiporter [Euryarchaeota archaeon]
MGGEVKQQGIGALLQWNALLISFALFVTLAILGGITEKNDWTNIGILIVLIIIALALLITSADFFVEGAKGLARRAGMAEVVIGLTIVSIGTSLPEILVTATASATAAGNDPALMDLAVGNIYGSILVQITLVLGIVVAFKPLEIRPAWLRRDGLLMLLSVLVLTALLWEGDGLTRIEGAILCLIYMLYIFWLLSDTNKIREDELEIVNEIKSSTEFSWSGTAYMIMVIIGLSMAVYSATQLVDYACEIAYKLNVPHAIVGSTMSGLGTSLPELTVAMVAVRKSQGVAIGTLIGSNITDPLLSIGIAALVAPITLTEASYDLTMYLIIPATIAGVALCLVMMWTGFKFSRLEGGILISFYLLFLVLIELQRQGYLSI